MGTEMFHFPTSPPTRLYIHPVVTTHNTQRGFPIRTPSDHSSFTNSPRLIADYRVLHRPLMPRHPPCALEHSPPHTNTHKPKSPYALQGDKTNNTRNTKTNKITTTTHSVIARCSRPLFTKQTTTTHQGHHPQHREQQSTAVGRDNNHTPNGVWACSPTTQQRACPHPHTTMGALHPRAPHSSTSVQKFRSVPPMSTPHTHHGCQGLPQHTPQPHSGSFGVCLYVLLLRKEVIQPHLPVRLPCYDFVPIASPTFDHSPQKG